MCCLYYYDHGTIEDAERIVGRTINSTFQGDVHPTDQALIITGKGNDLATTEMRWGFLGGLDRKQLMINARAESALEKKSFSESALRLTTEANDSMKKVHDRMPLILSEDQIKDWIHEDDMVRNFLAQPSPMLSKYQEYEQLTLW